MADTPTLTVRALAEMLDKPLYEQLRILEDQKYTDRAPGSFRVPYYRPALVAIRKFYRSGGQTQALEEAVAEIQSSSMPAARKDNNIRVIRAFQRSRHVRRKLGVTSVETMAATMTGVEVRYTQMSLVRKGSRRDSSSSTAARPQSPRNSLRQLSNLPYGSWSDLRLKSPQEVSS